MNNIYHKLTELRDSDNYPFHMPGHKRQMCNDIPKELRDIYGLDITEIDGFDNLHHATGILLQAEKRAAALYGADETFFLINGSTGGLLSAVSCVARADKKLLIARNCHKAVYNAVFLNRLEMEYIWPEMIKEYDIQGPVGAQQIEEKLTGKQEYCGIVITSPTYDGVSSDIQSIAELAHTHGIPLIVDEAHGAHFKFHDKFPQSALEQGADLVINSVHKTLPTLTQTALLHVQGELVNRQKLKHYLSIYQTSSPSYLMMSSIDFCMEIVQTRGKALFDKVIQLRDYFDTKTKDLKHIKIMSYEFKMQESGNRDSLLRTDPGKLVISVKNTELSGEQLADILRKKYHLEMEMAGADYVLGIVTCMDKIEGVERLANALMEIDRTIECDEKEEKNIDQTFTFYDSINNLLSEQTIYDAMNASREWIPLEKAEGRISGEFLLLYPPDIPIVVPGEKITRIMIEQIYKIKELKMNLIGLSDDGMEIFVNKNKR